MQLRLRPVLALLVPLLAAAALTLVAAAAETAHVVEPDGFTGAAIATALAQSQPGDTVRLRAGTYALTEPVRPRSGVKLVGAGQDQTTLVYTGDKASVLVNFHDCEDVELAHLAVDARQSPLVHQGISGGRSRKLWLHHLAIRNLASVETWGPHGILFSGHNPTCAGGVTDSKISDCRIENIGLQAKYGGGIRLAWGSDRNQVIGNTIQNTGRGGIFGDHAAELVIRENRVSGSGGEGLGIEIWGLCPRSLIEDNTIDHWLSVDQGHQSAVRRNVIGTDDGSLKGYGIEIIARNVVVTDNTVQRGAHIGLSVSNQPVKTNVFWGYNTVRDCVQWGAQLQGDAGGIAHHYFYRCTIENTVRGDAHARYPQDSGHAFRTNGHCRQLVLEDCVFRNNGGYGVQLGGPQVDVLTLRHCTMTGNGAAAVTRPAEYTALEFVACQVQGNQTDTLPEAKLFPAPPPTAAFASPGLLRAGQPAVFACQSRSTGGQIVERLWDFNDGIPEVSDQPHHTFSQPGKYRVTLIVWDAAGRGARAEQSIEVLPRE